MFFQRELRRLSLKPFLRTVHEKWNHLNHFSIMILLKMLIWFRQVPTLLLEYLKGYGNPITPNFLGYHPFIWPKAYTIWSSSRLYSGPLFKFYWKNSANINTYYPNKSMLMTIVLKCLKQVNRQTRKNYLQWVSKNRLPS